MCLSAKRLFSGLEILLKPNAHGLQHDKSTLCLRSFNLNVRGDGL